MAPYIAIVIMIYDAFAAPTMFLLLLLLLLLLPMMMMMTMTTRRLSLKESGFGIYLLSYLLTAAAGRMPDVMVMVVVAVLMLSCEVQVVVDCFALEERYGALEIGPELVLQSTYIKIHTISTCDMRLGWYSLSVPIGQKLEWEQIQYNCPMQQSAAPRHDDEADDGRERIQHPTSNNIVSEAGLQVNMRKIRHRFRP